MKLVIHSIIPFIKMLHFLFGSCCCSLPWRSWLGQQGCVHSAAERRCGEYLVTKLPQFPINPHSITVNNNYIKHTHSEDSVILILKSWTCQWSQYHYPIIIQSLSLKCLNTPNSCPILFIYFYSNITKTQKQIIFKVSVCQTKTDLLLQS